MTLRWLNLSNFEQRKKMQIHSDLDKFIDIGEIWDVSLNFFPKRFYPLDLVVYFSGCTHNCFNTPILVLFI